MASPTRKAKRQLNKMRKKVDRLEKVAIREYQVEGWKIHQELANFFAAQKYYPAGKNKLKKLKANKRSWQKRKAKLGLDLRRGHAGGTLQKAASARQSFIKNKQGWTISWPRANFKGRKRKGYKPGPVNTYFKHYNSKKAESSLGKPAPKQMTRAQKAVFKRIQKGIKKLLPEAIKVKGGIAEMKVKLGRFGDF